jgi:hypothetical protein
MYVASCARSSNTRRSSISLTHAETYDRITLNTIATSPSQHHNRLPRRFATQAVVGNKTNRYYRVHISVITDITTVWRTVRRHGCVWQKQQRVRALCTQASLQRINATPAPYRLECLGFKSSHAQFHNPDVAQNLQLMHCFLGNPTAQHGRKTKPLLSRACSSYYPSKIFI